MNERLARKYIGMSENLYENNLELSIGLDGEFHSEFKKYLYQRETDKEFIISGQSERTNHCYDQTDRRSRGSSKGKIYLNSFQRDTFPLESTLYLCFQRVT
eukprot:scaffold185002_cov36-Cyclotella_meneghiniana.AAC.2